MSIQSLNRFITSVRSESISAVDRMKAAVKAHKIAIAVSSTFITLAVYAAYKTGYSPFDSRNVSKLSSTSPRATIQHGSNLPLPGLKARIFELGNVLYQTVTGQSRLYNPFK